MAKEDLQTNVRLPKELKGQIEGAARQNGRSFTAEMVARLEASFESLDAVMLSNRLRERAIASRDIEGLVLRLHELIQQQADPSEVAKARSALEAMRSRRWVLEQEIEDLSAPPIPPAPHNETPARGGRAEDKPAKSKRR